MGAPLQLKIDWGHAETAAARIVLAYEICDAMADFAGEFTEMQAAAVTVAQITSAFSLVSMGVTEKQATAEFARAFRSVRRAANRLGGDPRLSEVMTEMHLDQRK